MDLQPPELEGEGSLPAVEQSTLIGTGSERRKVALDGAPSQGAILRGKWAEGQARTPVAQRGGDVAHLPHKDMTSHPN